MTICVSKHLEAGFDLLVVDEAHHLMWSEEEGGNDRYDLVEELAENTAGVLLLTATPEQLGVESHFARLRLLDPQRFSSLERFLDEEAQYQQTAQVAEVLMSDEPLTQEHLSALEGLLGHSIEDQPEQRFRAIHELLDRHGTGRILFRNTREAIQGFLAVIANLHLYLRQQIGQKTVNYASKCGQKKHKLMAHGCKMIRVYRG